MLNPKYAKQYRMIGKLGSSCYGCVFLHPDDGDCIRPSRLFNNAHCPLQMQPIPINHLIPGVVVTTRK